MMTVRILRVLLTVFLLAGAATPATTTLADRYRTGRILFRIDEDWTSHLPADLVFESRGDIAIAPDGSVFVSNANRHTIYKFASDGKFIKKFGQRGQGPGDLTGPVRLSILDDEYLVVGEYSEKCRISIFDLDGKFVKVVGTGRTTTHPIALKDGKIAFTSSRSRGEQDEIISNKEVIIIDWKSGSQKPVARYEIRNPMKRLPGGGIAMAEHDAVLIARTRDGGLVVGRTAGPRLDILSPDGVKLRTLDTGWKAIPVTSEYREKTRALQRRQAEAEGRKSLTNDPLLPEMLGILQDVWTDSEGNILVCRNTECLEGCPLAIRAYSPDGDFLCDFELDPGSLVLSADWRFKRIVLTAAGLYGLLEFKDDPDGFLHLVRTVFRPQ
jgi:hypothetical protein